MATLTGMASIATSPFRGLLVFLRTQAQLQAAVSAAEAARERAIQQGKLSAEASSVERAQALTQANERAAMLQQELTAALARVCPALGGACPGRTLSLPRLSSSDRHS